ncbi:MAG: hypothetical protein NZ555_05155 [Geminicoccaceae bacterium]|nr:hypothetical protein [Geminicoccaceae bacterium]MCX8102279.1 hypothetical protein [Geminicoccaceae bacterium]MDW8370825.1 hypothetical protein [Geminicoccaceae bacterium]
MIATPSGGPEESVAGLGPDLAIAAGGDDLVFRGARQPFDGDDAVVDDGFGNLVIDLGAAQPAPNG